MSSNDEDNNNLDDDVDSTDLSPDNMTTAKVATNKNQTESLIRSFKRTSISSESSQTTPNTCSDGGAGFGLSDSSLHLISSKPPLPRGIAVSTTHRNRSRSIETATFKANYRHSTGGRLWSRHFSHTGSALHDGIIIDEAAKCKR